MVKQLTIKNFKLKILNFITVAFILLVIVITYAINTSQSKSFEYYSNKSDEYINRTINQITQYDKQQYIQILKRIISSRNINQYIINNDREGLYKDLYPIFEKLQDENKYVHTLHVIEPNGESFLRVHKIEHFGDNLTDIRPMVKEIMQSQKTLYGYETGVHAQVFRVIIPLFEEDKYIGSIGLGINPVHFINKISKIIDEKGLLFLELENLKLYRVNHKFQIGNYFLQSDTDRDTLEILEKIPKNFNFENSYKVEIEEKNYLLHTTNISSFSGETTGKYLFIQDITEELERRQLSTILIIVILIIFVVILFLVIRYYILKFGNEVDEFYKFYEYAINGTQDGLWDWNLKTDEVYFSVRWKEMLGYRANELKNELSVWNHLVHPDDLENALHDIQSNNDKKTEFYENIHRLKHKNGSWVWILDRGKTFYDKNGKADRMVGFHTNITKIKSLEDEIVKKDELMIVQSRNAAMGEMISMIAHQWRQPLTVISMGANNVLADIELDMVDTKVLEEISLEIVNQTKELSQIIDDFKEFFKPTKKSEYISLVHILKQSLKIVGKSIENNNIKLSISCESKKVIEVYSRELLQVFINILNNAKEILVEKNIKNPQINVIIKEEDKNMKIIFSDNAGGVDEKIKSRIFEPYFSTKHEKIGTGLGLYMSKMIVEKHHNGTLKFFNENGGASFVIIVPFKIEKKEE